MIPFTNGFLAIISRIKAQSKTINNDFKFLINCTLVIYINILYVLQIFNPN